MTHQAVVLQVVLAEFDEIVRERLPPKKELLEAAETAVEWMTGRVDDPGAGQHQAKQADVLEIVRQFVGEEPGLLAIAGGRVEIPPARAVRTRPGSARGPLPDNPLWDPAMRGRSGSSNVPLTSGWDARICSISVEPDRGMPTMKIGNGPSPALFGDRVEARRVECLDQAIRQQLGRNRGHRLRSRVESRFLAGSNRRACANSPLRSRILPSAKQKAARSSPDGLSPTDASTTPASSARYRMLRQ